MEVSMEKLLLVEDDQGLREQMKWALGADFQVLEADSLDSAMAAARREEPALVCLDMGLEGRSDRGLDVLDALLALHRDCKVVVITGNGSEAAGREALHHGAFDYLEKPLEAADLEVILERAARIRDLEAVDPEPSAMGGPGDPEFPMLGESEAMRRVFGLLRRLADTEVSVLITGESGTGKELCARAIHHHGRRRNRAFVPINCGAIPESLMESELFGYLKGAFTGADADKAGLIEAAHKGTLFLDEIGDMPAGLQVKLLRFLQDQRLQRVGATRPISVDVRVIAATHRSDISVPGNPSLRPDLYYRLSEFEFDLPPLRERDRDALLITAKIVADNRIRFAQPRLRLSSRAEKLILTYGWPGNVRELENRLNRAAITCRNQVIEPEDLCLDEGLSKNLSYKEARRNLDRTIVLGALRRANGNVSLAARAVGVTRPTFYDLMRKVGINLRTQAKG